MPQCTWIVEVPPNNGQGWWWRRNGFCVRRVAGPFTESSAAPSQETPFGASHLSVVPLALTYILYVSSKAYKSLPFALSGQRWSYSGVAGACSFWRRTCAFWRSQRRSLYFRGNSFRRHHPITCGQISSWFLMSVRVSIQAASLLHSSVFPSTVNAHKVS